MRILNDFVKASSEFRVSYEEKNNIFSKFEEKIKTIKLRINENYEQTSDLHYY